MYKEGDKFKVHSWFNLLNGDNVMSGREFYLISFEVAAGVWNVSFAHRAGIDTVTVHDINTFCAQIQDSSQPTQSYSIGDKVRAKLTGEIYRVVSIDYIPYCSYLLESEVNGARSMFDENNLNTKFDKINQPATTANQPLGGQASPSHGIPVFWQDPHSLYKFNIPKGFAAVDYGVEANTSNDFYSQLAQRLAKSETRCDCGSAKTYGESCGPEMHASYCSTRSKNV